MSIMWGTWIEKDAVSSFSKTTGLVVNKTGIWLDDAGILGASPDGLTGENALQRLNILIPCKMKLCEGLKQRHFFLMAWKEDLFFAKRSYLLVPGSETATVSKYKNVLFCYLDQKGHADFANV